MKLLTGVVWAVALGCLVGAVGGWGAAQALHVPTVDAMASYNPAETTRVFDAAGVEVASFGVEQRVVLRPEQIPNHLKLAIVAAEDVKFYEHGGVDPKAVLRAVVGSIRTGTIGGQGGGSTITQQLALNLFLQRERTITRKAREALLAIDIEKRYSKDQIITMYANQIFLGHGAYGVEAAAKLYFGKPAAAIDLAEAALLAGIIPSPNNKFDVVRRPEAVRERRDRVLQKMFELGFVDRAALEAALAAPAAVTLHREAIESGAYFLEMVRQEIESRYGTDALYRDGREVHLTMDSHLQALAETALREGLVALDMRLGYRRPRNVVKDGTVAEPAAWKDADQRELVAGAMVRAMVLKVGGGRAELRVAGRPAELTLDGVEWTGAAVLGRLVEPGDVVLVRLPDPLPALGSTLVVELLQEPEIEGAMVVMDNRTGAVLALVGGYDFARSEFNRAVQSKLQCGSTFKPFVYLTAFAQGFSPADTLFDAPFLLPDSTGQLAYCPRNYYNKYYGITTLRQALELSFNSVAVKTQEIVGGDAVVRTAEDFGISTELHPYASLALGSLEVRLVDLVRAYAGFANLGEVPEPYFISEVYDRSGTLEDRAFPSLKRVAPAPVTYLLVHVLEGVIDRGTGASAAALEANLAGKTGTTDDYSDAWFVGFSPRITVGVWVGRNVKAPIGPHMTGAVAAQPIWNQFMADYLAGLSPEERAEAFPVPAGVVFSPVDYYTGRAALPLCASASKVVLEAFLDGTEPTASCTAELHALHDMPWPFQQAYYTPRPNEPMPTAAALGVADGRLRR